MPLPVVMPDEWVQQIKRSLPSSWATLMGSSVLAAVIAWGASYSTAKLTIAGNVALEHEKAELQKTAEVARQRSVTYANLAVALRDLSDTYKAYQVLVQSAMENGRLHQDDVALERQAGNVGKAVLKVTAASASIDSGQLKTDINQSVGEVVITLSQGATDRKAVLAHSEVGIRLADLGTQAQQISDAHIVF